MCATAGHKKGRLQGQSEEGRGYIRNRPDVFQVQSEGSFKEELHKSELSGSSKDVLYIEGWMAIRMPVHVDSGCTDHVMNDRCLLKTMKVCSQGHSVVNPNGSLATVEGKGNVEALIADTKGAGWTYSFAEVLLCQVTV